MSTSLFQAEDWVYVADSMGRLGQGYYKNRNNQSQTITPAEFEKRRSQSTNTASNTKEQNININNNSSSSSSGLLASSGSDGDDLSPWDNPIIGEQAVTTSSQKTATQEKTPAATQAQAQTQLRQPKAESESNSGDGSETNQGFSSNHGDVGADDGAGAGAKAKAKDNGGSVICTELSRQGLMRDSARRASTIYALSRLPNSFMTGYQFWAVPYVRLMRRSKLATRIMSHLVNWRTDEVCYRMGLRKSGSFPGKILCMLHDPLCCVIGQFVQKTDYSTLYKQETSS